MNHRSLGASGVHVSPLCLGTMMFGGATDVATSERIISMAGDAGVNFIDTADVYTKGESERIVGRAIRGDRDRWVVATKAGNQVGDDPGDRGLSRPEFLAHRLNTSSRSHASTGRNCTGVAVASSMLFVCVEIS